MKKLLGVLLSLCMVMCFMPSLAFAGSTGYSLQTKNAQGKYTNYLSVSQGETLAFTAYKVKFNNNSVISKKIISDGNTKFHINGDKGGIVRNISFTASTNGKVKLNVKKSCEPGLYSFNYEASAEEFSDGNCIGIFVKGNTVALKFNKLRYGNIVESENDQMNLLKAEKKIVYFYGTDMKNGKIDDEKRIIPSSKDIVITDSNGNKTKDITWTKGFEGRTTIKVSSDCKIGKYYLKYIGKKCNITNQKIITLNINDGIAENTINNLRVSTSGAGLTLDWDNNLVGIDGVEIYKSVKPNSGFEKVCLESNISNNHFTDKWGLEKGKTYYYKVRGMKYLEDCEVYTDWSNVAYATSQLDVEDDIVKHVNSMTIQDIYQLPNVKKMISNPKSESDYLNNILYSYMNGNYALNYKFSSLSKAKDFAKKIRSRLQLLSAIYPDLAANYGNALCSYEFDTIKKSKGKYVFTFKIPNAPLSDMKIYANAKSAIKTAKQIYIDLHKTQKITNDMNEKDRALVISKYLKKRKISDAQGGDCKGVENIYFDTAYSNLVARRNCCGGWASSFNLVAHIEGLYSNGVTALGHITNRIVVDGTEYFHDTGWGSYFNSYNAFNRMAKFEQKPLKYVREHSVKYKVATESAE